MEKLQQQVEEMIEFVQEQVSTSLSGSLRNALVRVPSSKIVRSQQ